MPHITLSTHILDTSIGRPAVGVEVILLQSENGILRELTRAATNEDGRITNLGSNLKPGRYQLRFATEAYFQTHGKTAFYPEVTVDFRAELMENHYHVPLLLSPFGYSTYRGS